MRDLEKVKIADSLTTTELQVVQAKLLKPGSCQNRPLPATYPVTIGLPGGAGGRKGKNNQMGNCQRGAITQDLRSGVIDTITTPHSHHFREHTTYSANIAMLK